MQAHYPSPNCVICGKPGGNPLVNGTVYHSTCYEGLLSRLSGKAAQKWSLEKELEGLEGAKLRSESFWGKVLAFFQGKVFSLDDYRLRSSAIKKETLSLEIEIGRLNQILCDDLYAYWPTYPPDWEDRRHKAKARDGRCVRCGETRDLHVDHVCRVGDGGNHLLSNLQVLCERCHAEKHGVKTLAGKETGQRMSSAFVKRLALIKQAIDTGKSIRFLYSKVGSQDEEGAKDHPTGESRTDRQIPLRSRMVFPKESGAVFCNKKNERRPNQRSLTRRCSQSKG